MRLTDDQTKVIRQLARQVEGAHLACVFWVQV